MNNEFLLKVVNYVADHFGNLPDNSKPGFENFTNDEFDTAVKYLAEIGVLKLNQSKDFSYCGRRDIETNDDSALSIAAFVSESSVLIRFLTASKSTGSSSSNVSTYLGIFKL